MTVVVVNKYTHKPTSNDVYIGRGSKWGNPFVIGKHGTRDQVIDKYAEWITEQDHLVNCFKELRNKNLVCFCAPQRCHGEVLKFICDELYGEGA